MAFLSLRLNRSVLEVGGTNHHVDPCWQNHPEREVLSTVSLIIPSPAIVTTDGYVMTPEIGPVLSHMHQ